MLMSRLFSTKSCRIILSLTFCNRIWNLRKYFLSIFSPIHLNLVGVRLLQWQRPSAIWLILTIVTKINLRVHQNESSKVTCWPLNQCWKGDLSCFRIRWMCYSPLHFQMWQSWHNLSNFKNNCGYYFVHLLPIEDIFIQNSICWMAVAELSLFLIQNPILCQKARAQIWTHSLTDRSTLIEIACSMHSPILDYYIKGFTLAY